MDITDASRAEDELRSARLSAEEARAAAEAASSAKDHFLAVLSHELRNPLTPVLAATEMLESGKALSAEHREIVQMIRRNVELETRLIDDLLDITRISRNKLELQLSTLDVHEKIAYAVEVCRQDAELKQLSVETELSAENHHVNGDSARFQQIIWNLLKNAIKFTPASGRITIRTANRPGGTIVVEVIDSGVGIDATALPLIFDAFEQGDPKITRQFGGLGLGLSISKVLVELHGGTIKAASEGKGKGATFTVEMPYCAEADPTREVSNVGHGGKLNCTILLVEDHPDTRRAMEWLLRQLGCEVQTAATVGEAIEAAAKHEFDLVISDIGLPDATGMVLMRQLKFLYGLKGIALSGYGTDRDVSNSKAAGFDVHLTKPVNLQVLEEAVRRVMVLQ